jgi:dihydrofolate synthase/folylpolyglutamate synthase
MAYPETVKYLESFINYEKIPAYPYKESLKLERIEEFLESIGNPQDALKCIHVAGTKGKGSTCAFISYILRQAGYRVGLYTSPHLSDFRERIRILAQQSDTLTNQAKCEFEGIISESELAQLLEILKPKIEDYNKNSEYGQLSFFEVYTSLAFVYFKEKKVDFAVLETGLGGRLDATNVVNPYVCAITPLSYEHTQKLGNTLREIAAEKAGIIKAQSVKCKAQNLIVISAPQEKEAIEVIRNKCKKVDARLYEVERDITYQKTNNGFNIKGIFGEYPNLEIRLLGDHQLINAAVAIGAVEALRFYNINININAIRVGLYDTLWPGRCEIISRNPLLVLDGAQNVASTLALRQAIKANFKYKKLILVLGVSCDKDIKGICKELYDLLDTVILTRANNSRAAEPERLAEYFKAKETYITNNVEEAVTYAQRIARKEDLILVCGSLFVVGEFRNGKQ